MLNQIIKELKTRYNVYTTNQKNGETMITICSKADLPIMVFTVDKDYLISGFRACGSFYQIKDIMDFLADKCDDNK